MKNILIGAGILTCVIILTAILLKRNEPKEKIIVVPPNAFLIISDTPATPVAYKLDTVQPWVILDSTRTLKVLLQSIENDYKNRKPIKNAK